MDFRFKLPFAKGDMGRYWFDPKAVAVEGITLDLPILAVPGVTAQASAEQLSRIATRQWGSP